MQLQHKFTTDSLHFMSCPALKGERSIFHQHCTLMSSVGATVEVFSVHIELFFWQKIQALGSWADVLPSARKKDAAHGCPVSMTTISCCHRNSFERLAAPRCFTLPICDSYYLFHNEHQLEDACPHTLYE